MVRIAATALVLALVAGVGRSAEARQSPASGPRCQSAGPFVAIADLPEASGVAVSRHPGRLWVHNDGQPVLVAVSTRGSVVGRVSLVGAPIRDWEAVAVGKCPSGSCVFIGDIGDNQARRERITVYRVPEPDVQASVAVKESFHATYPDGPRDAETLLVAPDGAMFILSKGEGGPVALYRFPKTPRPGVVHMLERVGTLPAAPAGRSRRRVATSRITDGSVSPDGQWVVLRTGQALMFYPAAEFLAGTWREAARVDLRGIRESQGEGVAMAADGSIYLVGEGGGKGRAGTFARLNCSLR